MACLGLTPGFPLSAEEKGKAATLPRWEAAGIFGKGAVVGEEFSSKHKAPGAVPGGAGAGQMAEPH